MSSPEILAPAGSFEALTAAVRCGADAVYLGGSALSLRAKCRGFDGQELARAVRDAHSAGVRVYYCLNAMPFDEHLPLVEKQLESVLGIKNGGITPDKRFSLDATRCIGACGLAPVMTVGEDVYGRLTPDDIEGIIAKYN